MSVWRPERQSPDPRLSAFEDGPDPAFVTEGSLHRIVTANAAARALLGAHIVGRTVADAAPGLVHDQLDLWLRTGAGGAPSRSSSVHLRDAEGAEGASYDLMLSPWCGSDGEPQGVIAYLSAAPSALDESLLALDHSRASQAAGPAAQLQEAVLPRHLPVLARADVAATYLLAEEGRAGGDWFDVVPTPDGAIALVVGDVVGRGVGSVATMAQLRAVVRERLRTGATITTALAAADALAHDVPDAAAATMCIALFDPRSGDVAYCTAGHPPPLHVEPSGGALFLPRSGGSALATTGEFPVLDHELDLGEMLLLYTDGAVERPSRTSAQNTLDLAGAAGRTFGRLGGGHGIRGTVDGVCRGVLAQLVAETGHDDDMALLAIERMPPPYPVDLSLPVAPASVGRARDALADWLHDLQVRDLDEMAILHAVGEVVSNAVEHAYVEVAPPEVDAITLTATVEWPGEAVVVVRDRGRWRPGGSSGRGRGLTMARGFADDLRADRGPDGTRVTLRHEIGRPVGMFSSEDRTGASVGTRSAGLEHVRTEPDGAGRVSVHGQVDEMSVDDLREDLTHWTRGGTTSLVVDLSDVTILGSAGVQLLVELLAWRNDGVSVELVANAGTPAQHVLVTVGLPHRSA